jgi:predicted SAM-dependent methyltransferase
MSQYASPLQSLKRVIVRLVGRERANRISAPYHDWRARRRTQKFLSSLPPSELLVNLGCGPRAMSGWVNLDAARGDQVDVVWDLAKGLPFPTGSCAAIFGEHVIEHLPKHAAEALLRDCHRALKPGGVLRLSTPDAARYLRSYVGDGEFLRHPNFAQPIETRLDRVNMVMREGGQHLWLYDAESLLLLLTRAGFSSAIEQSFRRSLHPRLQEIDVEERSFESLYVEGMK